MKIFNSIKLSLISFISALITSFLGLIPGPVRLSAIILTALWLGALILNSYMQKKENRNTTCKRRMIELTTFLLLILLFFGAARGTSYFIRSFNSENEFRFRLDDFLIRSGALYDPGMLPASIYKIRRKVANRTFDPAIVDSSHRYDEINATFFDYEGAVTVEYFLKGSTYPNGSKNSTFIVHGETKDIGNLGEIDCKILNASGKFEKLKCSARPRSTFTENFLAIGKIQLPDNFAYFRKFRAKGALSEKHDGVVVDFRNLAHPPKTTEIVLITDHKLHNVEIARLIKSNNMWNWLWASPRFQFDTAWRAPYFFDGGLKELKGPEAEPYLKQARAQVKNDKKVDNSKILVFYVWRVRFNLDGSNPCFLLSFQAENK